MPTPPTRIRFTLSHELSPESLAVLKEILHERFKGHEKAKQKESMALTRRLNSLGKRNFDGKYWRLFTMKGNCLEHRVIMERKLGRPLLRAEQIHHRDENQTNNDPDNLELTNQSAHMSLHRKKDMTPQFRYAKDGKWSMKYDVCITCKSNKRKYAENGLCEACSNAKRRLVRTKPNKPRHGVIYPEP